MDSAQLISATSGRSGASAMGGNGEEEEEEEEEEIDRERKGGSGEWARKAIEESMPDWFVRVKNICFVRASHFVLRNGDE